MKNTPIMPILAIVAGIGLAIMDTSRTYDSTDDEVNNVRSGLKLYTDYGTGCQYISKFFGDLHPRLDKNGKQICKKEMK